ncbi:MAG TPA: class I SAM-dependent methyltransferase [Solirubrobacteraceae bacterium]|jgi:demethylmenaquinone methyltransferase/2-methoxy-6-polyprenyl-1,4-benzoquinol methylase|nr:class I SAM-dependent methyltransferase [Solirubrobacteraceae bacterium]
MTPTHVATPRLPSERKRHALQLFEGLPRRYDLIAALFSFGQDPRWRRTIVRALRPSFESRVLDVATGTGMVAAALVYSSGCTVVGLDQSASMLARAQHRVDGDPNLRGHVTLVRGEAEHLPFADHEFDALTFTYLLRYVDDPASMMRELARVVKPGGRIASLDFGVPPLLPARLLWRVYTRAGLPLLGLVVSHDWYEVGRFLGPNIEGFYARHPLDRVVELWREAGIDDVEVRRMSLGGGVVMSGVKRDVGPAA